MTTIARVTAIKLNKLPYWNELSDRKVARMKINDIEVGGVYWTRVSGVLTQVEVVGIVTKKRSPSSKRAIRRLQLKRVDNGNRLPKLRTAAALRPTNERYL